MVRAKRLLEMSPRRLEAILVVVAIVFSIVLILREQGRINDDGVLYLEVAKHFVRGDWHGGWALYPWSLYSMLVAGVSGATGISLEASANSLSVMFFAIATLAFTRLIRLVGGNNYTVAAGAVLLFTNGYIVADVLPLIWRDQGFWATFLTSLCLFVRYYRYGRVLDVLIWQVIGLCAALFRTEGLMFLVLTPPILLFKSGNSPGQRGRQLLLAYSLSLLVVAAITLGQLAGWIAPDTVPPPVQMARTYLSQIYLQISEGLEAKAQIFDEQVLGRFVGDYAMHGLLLTLLAVILGNIIGVAGWLNFLLASFQVWSRKNLQMNRDATVVLYWSGAIAIINMLLTVLAYFLLAGRYVVPFALILTVFGAFGLTALFQNADQAAPGRGRKRLLFIIAFILFVQGSLIFKPKPAGYTYEIQAVNWAREYAQDDRRVFYDNARLRYYAGLPIGERGKEYTDEIAEAIRDGSLVKHDVLVLHIEREDVEQERYIIEKLGYKPVKEFTAHRKASIVVLDRHAGGAH